MTKPVISLTAPFTEADYDRLELLLRRVNRDSMSLAELDGFFCALVCGPGRGALSEYFPHVVGSDLGDDRAFHLALVDPEELVALLTRHWNQIAAALLAGKPYLPIFDIDDADSPVGDRWSQGFVEGMDLDQAAWDRFTRHKDHWATVAPMMFMLAEQDPEIAPELKKTPTSREERIELLATTSICLSHIFQDFHGDGGKCGAKAK